MSDAHSHQIFSNKYRMEDKKERLFEVANQIDVKVATVKKQATVMVGLSRVGKSTSYNWVMGHPLKTLKEGGRVCYEPEIIRTETAEVKSGMKSCTLVPNIVPLGDQTSFIDMQGFGEKRDSVGTLAVSYSLKAIFQTVEEVKFIIVMTQKMLNSEDGNSLCQTMNHFLSLFNFTKMSEEMKEKLYFSTALLVTQSKHQAEHLDFIERNISQLEDQQLQNVSNRQYIVELLKHIIHYNRIDKFHQATLGNPPEECTVLQFYATKDWEYFSIKEVEPLQIITLPFQKQYKRMKKEDKTKFTTAIESRLKSYKQFSDIFINLFEEIFVEKTIHDIKIPYDNFFKEIDKFIYNNDHYSSEESINSKQLVSAQFYRPHKEKLFNLFLQFKDVLTFDPQLLNLPRKIIAENLSKAIIRLCELIAVIFCRNSADLKRILQVRFILLRGVREFYMLFNVYEQIVSSSYNEIRDRLEMIMQYAFKDHLLHFLNCFDMETSERITFAEKNTENVLESYFSSRENAFALEVIFKLHEQELLNLGSEAKDQYFQLLRDTKLIHAKYQYDLCNYKQSCDYLLEAFRLEVRYEWNCLHRLRYDLDKGRYNRLVEHMHLNQETIMDLIKQNLIKLKKYAVALELTKSMRWIHSTCQIYQLKLRHSSKKEQFDTVQEYAHYCFAHNRREKGIMLLQQLLQLEKTSFAKKKEINKSIYKYIEREAELKQVYKDFLENFETIDLMDPQREEVIRRIEKSLRDNSELKSILQLCKQHISLKKNSQADEEQQFKFILKQYLQQRLQNEAIVVQNGFKVKYLDDSTDQYVIDKKKEQICTSIKINNSVELEELTKNLLTALERQSKRNIEKQKIITIDLAKVTKNYKQITEKHMIITLNSQQIRPTFEYATKIMKNVKKMVNESHQKFKAYINHSKNTIETLKKDIERYILQRYYSAMQSFENIETEASSEEANKYQSTRSNDDSNYSKNTIEVRKIIQIIQSNLKASSEDIFIKFKKEYPDSGLIKAELFQMFDQIKQQLSKELILNEVEGFDESVNMSLSQIN